MKSKFLNSVQNNILKKVNKSFSSKAAAGSESMQQKFHNIYIKELERLQKQK